VLNRKKYDQQKQQYFEFLFHVFDLVWIVIVCLIDLENYLMITKVLVSKNNKAIGYGFLIYYESKRIVETYLNDYDGNNLPSEWYDLTQTNEDWICEEVEKIQ